MGKQMLPREVRCSNRLKLWKIMDIFRRCWRSCLSFSSIRFCPWKRTLPLSGRSRRLMQRTNVLLPAPDRPMMPKISPFSMEMDTFCRAFTWFSPLPKVLHSFCSSIIAAKIIPPSKRNRPCTVRHKDGKTVLPPCFARPSQEHASWSTSIPPRCNGRPRWRLNHSPPRLRNHVRRLRACPLSTKWRLSERL